MNNINMGGMNNTNGLNMNNMNAFSGMAGFDSSNLYNQMNGAINGMGMGGGGAVNMNPSDYSNLMNQNQRGTGSADGSLGGTGDKRKM